MAGHVSHRPAGVRRRVVSASALAVVAVLAGILALADELRHPLPGDGELVAPDIMGDPREPVECPEPAGEPAMPGQLAAPAEPVEVASDDLLDCPRSYDGRMVRYVGEAVGEVLVRRDHAWVQLNDDPYSEAAPLPQRPDYAGGNSGIGVRLPRDGAEEIVHTGGPRHHGDIVAVKGRFHRTVAGTADPMAIDAAHVEQVRAGEAITEPVLGDRRIVAIALGLLAAAMVVAERVIARRR